jgi:hypothetical protein
MASRSAAATPHSVAARSHSLPCSARQAPARTGADARVANAAHKDVPPHSGHWTLKRGLTRLSVLVMPGRAITIFCYRPRADKLEFDPTPLDCM